MVTCAASCHKPIQHAEALCPLCIALGTVDGLEAHIAELRTEVPA